MNYENIPVKHSDIVTLVCLKNNHFAYEPNFNLIL